MDGLSCKLHSTNTSASIDTSPVIMVYARFALIEQSL